MDERRKSTIDLMERSGYLPTLRLLARSFCCPFWWHGTSKNGSYGVLHNGTVCFVDTGTRTIAITAAHVYRQYLKDKATDAAIVCQFGGITVQPAEKLIDCDDRLDLATFDTSDVVAAASGASVHVPNSWPTSSIREGDAIMFGGFPGVLRSEGADVLNTPFQSFAGAATNVGSDNIGLTLDLPNLYWPQNHGGLFNAHLGGLSGGPVFRVISTPIERLELAAIIYEYQTSYELMLVRPLTLIEPDGHLVLGIPGRPRVG